MKRHVYAMFFSVILAFISLGITIGYTTPEETSLMIKILFFLALFVAIWEIISLLFIGIVYQFRRGVYESGDRKGLKEFWMRQAYMYGFLFSIIILFVIIINRV